ncbi:MAG: hypothetical protein UIC65_00770, partial [Alphaproteobacteria bacterium]|nr:hypothetical protein [Alphaproteobacteria bacterium]
KVVARAAKPVVSQPAADMGAHIVASNDVLVPQRPSADLWAKNDVALRMPKPSEFSVYRTDSQLPEERIDQTHTVAKTVAPAVKTQAVSAMPEIDSQIARLVDLQKRAEESVRTVSPRVIAAPIVQNDTAPVRVAAVTEEKPEQISLRRMVVDMDDNDVIVRKVEKNTSPRIASVREDMTKMTPNELRNAFRKTFLSENKHLSTYSVDDSFDVASDMSSSIEGFTAKADLSEGSGIRPLEIKIKFRDDDSALSRANYNLLTEYAGIVVNKPTRAIQIAIPQQMTVNNDVKKLTARRLAIVEQVLTDNGVSKQRIVPVLSNRQESGFVLRVISGDQYDSLTQQQYNIFGDNVGKKTYKSMSW